MEELKKIKKSEAAQTAKVRIEVSGFPGANYGGKFFERIVRDGYKRLFEGSNLRMDRSGAIVFEITICCKTTDQGTHWYAGSDTMHHCLDLGTGCPF